MNKTKKISFLFVFALVFSMFLTCLSYADETHHYATTDMTWAEFYAAEVDSTIDELQSSGLDAFSTPTVRAASRFALLSADVGESSTTIYGLKNVRVRMSDSVYSVVSAEPRYNFVDEEFTTDYKDVISDGIFGKMVTETSENTSGATLSTGSSARWGNYVIVPSDVTVTAANYLGAVVETDDGEKYGMRHDSNIWTNNNVAITVKEGFTEAHGYPREYKYTEGLEGKTVSKITYMFLDSPDVEVSGLELFLKYTSDASVKISGDYVAEGTDVTAAFEIDAPDDADYVLKTFSKGEYVENLRHGQPGWRYNALTEGTDYTYSSADQTVTISGQIANDDRFQAEFESEKYGDISTTFIVVGFDATSLIVSPDKNLGGVNFLLTPRGVIEAIDTVLEENKFLNASEVTNIISNDTAEYNEGVEGTGFTINVALNIESEDYTGIVGIGKITWLTPANLGDSFFSKLYDELENNHEVGESGFYEFGNFTELNKLGLRPVLVQSDDTHRDLSTLTGAGLMVSDDENIMIYYGTMAADCNSDEIQEGEYLLSPEGEYLVSDGIRDGAISLSMFIEKFERADTPSDDSSSYSNNNMETNTNSNSDSNSDNSTGGGSTNTTTSGPLAIREFTAPKLDVTNPDTKKTVTDAVKAKVSNLSDNVEVAALSASDEGIGSVAPRETSSLSDADKKYVEDQNQEIAAVLPVVEVLISKIYVFNVVLSNLNFRDPIFWQSMARSSASSSEFKAADDASSQAVFFDSQGNEVTKVPSDKTIDVAVYLEAGKTYEPLITTQASSTTNNDTSDNTESDNSNQEIGGSGGGCNSMNILASAMLAGLALISRKR